MLVGLLLPTMAGVAYAQRSHHPHRPPRPDSSDSTLVSVRSHFRWPAHPHNGSGTLQVTVQPVTFSVSDGLPARLRPDRTYRATFVFLLSRGFGTATVRVSARRGSLHDCEPRVVRPGLARISCVVHTSASRRGVDLVLTVGSRSKGYATATYHHDRRRTAGDDGR
jgi:hypothetical protein